MRCLETPDNLEYQADKCYLKIVSSKIVYLCWKGVVGCMERDNGLKYQGDKADVHYRSSSLSRGDTSLASRHKRGTIVCHFRYGGSVIQAMQQLLPPKPMVYPVFPLFLVREYSFATRED